MKSSCETTSVTPWPATNIVFETSSLALVGVMFSNQWIVVLARTICCVEGAIRTSLKAVPGVHIFRSYSACPFDVSNDDTDASCDLMIATGIDAMEQACLRPGRLPVCSDL